MCGTHTSIGRTPEQLGLPRVQLQPITSHPAGDVVETLRNFQRESVNVSRARAVNLGVVGILVRRKAMLRNNYRKVSDIQYE